jgi:CRISPR/Cas system-associated endonuclease Cas1
LVMDLMEEFRQVVVVWVYMFHKFLG